MTSAGAGSLTGSSLPPPTSPIAPVWLVRNAENQLLGPFTQEEICAMIKDRKLTALDEVCRANHYWFYLHEDAEVLGQLGLTVSVYNPKKNGPGEDSTQTDTATEEDTDTDRFVSAEDIPRSRRSKVVPVAPGVTTQFRRAPRRAVEPTSFWRGIVWALAVLVVVLLYTVLRILEKSGGPPRLPG